MRSFFSKYLRKKSLFPWCHWQKSHWFKRIRILTSVFPCITSEASLKEPVRKQNTPRASLQSFLSHTAFFWDCPQRDRSYWLDKREMQKLPEIRTSPYRLCHPCPIKRSSMEGPAPFGLLHKGYLPKQEPGVSMGMAGEPLLSDLLENHL